MNQQFAPKLSGNSIIFSEFVRRFPGSHFREICRLLRMPVGTADYNLRKLRRLGSIEEETVFGKKAYFPPGFPRDERRRLVLIRNPKVRIIMRSVSSGSFDRKSVCASASITMPTLTWYVGKMLSEGILKGSVRSRLSVDQDSARIASRYKSSFSGRMVDNFVSMWDE